MIPTMEVFYLNNPIWSFRFLGFHCYKNKVMNIFTLIALSRLCPSLPGAAVSLSLGSQGRWPACLTGPGIGWLAVWVTRVCVGASLGDSEYLEPWRSGVLCTAHTVCVPSSIHSRHTGWLCPPQCAGPVWTWGKDVRQSETMWPALDGRRRHCHKHHSLRWEVGANPGKHCPRAEKLSHQLCAVKAAGQFSWKRLHQ